MTRIIEALIEIPMGSQNKYEVDKKNHRIKLDRVLYSATFYPAEYGYVENTLGLDGDPIDILVFTSYATFPGCYIESRIIGALDMIDGGDVDTKLMAVCIGDPRYEHVQMMSDMSPHMLKEIEHFFATYKQLQAGKGTHVLGWLDIPTAIRLLDDSFERYEENKKLSAANT